MDYLIKATPTGGLSELSAEERDELMAREREVATALIRSGAITWMWRLPDTGTSLAIWNAESAEALDAHLRRCRCSPTTSSRSPPWPPTRPSRPHCAPLQGRRDAPDSTTVDFVPGRGRFAARRNMILSTEQHR
ncbi:muconolactone Delta-isomerase family protein [Actinomycetospora sp. CA-101289]|uniref:muconolactone Delta-isomerase family protein n=1 Tax=Actinomycetospora sp. CA-101289 TaxID=3239893 RepID=UPI003D9645DC